MAKSVLGAYLEVHGMKRIIGLSLLFCAWVLLHSAVGSRAAAKAVTPWRLAADTFPFAVLMPRRLPRRPALRRLHEVNNLTPRPRATLAWTGKIVWMFPALRPGTSGRVLAFNHPHYNLAQPWAHASSNTKQIPPSRCSFCTRLRFLPGLSSRQRQWGEPFGPSRAKRIRPAPDSALGTICATAQGHRHCGLSNPMSQ